MDPKVQLRVQSVIDRARRSGANIPVRLHDAQLLWTKEQEHRIRVETIRDLLQEFEVWKPHEFLRSINRSLVNSSPAEMHQAIQKFLWDYLNHVRAGSAT